MINFLQGTQVITELGKRLTSALEEPLKEVARPLDVSQFAHGREREDRL